jgi:hypothetical protein
MRYLLIVLYKFQETQRKFEVIVRWDPHDEGNEEKWKGGYRFLHANSAAYSKGPEYIDLLPTDANEILEAVKVPDIDDSKLYSGWNFGKWTFHISWWSRKPSSFDKDL